MPPQSDTITEEFITKPPEVNRPCEALILSDEQQESWISTSDSDCGCFTDLCVKQQEAPDCRLTD